MALLPEVLGGRAQNVNIPANFGQTLMGLETMAEMEPLLADFERATGLSLMPADVGPATLHDGMNSIAMSISASDQAGMLVHRYVALVPTGVGLALKKQSVQRQTTPLNSAVANMRVPTTLHLDGPIMSRGELAALKTGDVVLVPESYAARWSARLELPAPYGGWEGKITRADAEGQQMSFVADAELPMLAFSHHDEAEPLLLGTGAGNGRDLPGLWEQLPVSLTFAIDSIEASLDELVRLGPGSMVPLPDGDGASSGGRLLANGYLVGRGYMLKLGQGYGVQVQTLAGIR